jgi:MscS family membrane protein
MTEFFARTYYGNTVGEWLTTFLMILGAVILGRALYWLFSRSVKSTIKRNRARFDDVLLDAVEEPVVLLITLLVARAVIRRLSLPETLVSVIDDVIGMAYALLVAWLLTRLYDAVHHTYLKPFANRTAGAFDDQILPMMRRGLRVIIWAVAIIVGLNNAGYDVGTVLAGLGIGGLAVALAAQDTVGNVFGGVTLFAQKPFLIGDLIEFEGKQYTVKEIGWRATIVEDWNTGYRVTIPNSKFTNGIIANVSAERGYWFEQTIRLAGDLRSTQVEQALQDIRDAVCCHPNIDGHKVRFEAFGVNAFEFLVLFHVSSFNERWQVITDANLDLLRRFEAHGIRLAAPMQVNVNGDGRPELSPLMDEAAARKIAAAAATEAELPSAALTQ